MTRSLEGTDGLSVSDAKVLSDIREVGWHITGVFAQKRETGPEWAFSIGLFHSFQHPEVILFGLPYESCMGVVSVVGTQVQAGVRYEPGKEYADILEGRYKCAFREVHPAHYQEYLGFALWFYEKDPFPLLQCFWPDKQGCFPWDTACNEYVRNAQPLLHLPSMADE